MKKLSRVLCVIMLLTMLMSMVSCGTSIQEDWKSVIVGDNVPTPQKGKLDSGSNLDNFFSGSVDNVSEEYYNEYVNSCIDMGYNVESKKTGSIYEAFNKDGYEISLSYISGDMHIIIQVPEELTEIVWPTTGIGAILPAPISTVGKVTSDSSTCYRVTVGNTTMEDYNKYVTECEANGFNVDYTKQEGIYEAKNADGYRLNITYLGCNRIDIMIQTPKEETLTQTPEVTPNQETTEEVGKEFKEAMDSYEKFFDDYIAFMKKYSESDGTDLSIIADYAKYVADYADMMKEFEAWEEKELNDAETAYYITVQGRINQKLLEVAQ